MSSSEFVRDLPAELQAAYFPKELPEYFLDPQEFLAEKRRESLLQLLTLHSKEARSQLRVLLLSPGQRIPPDIDLHETYAAWFSSELPVLLIYYFGNPEMSRLVFSDETERRVDAIRLDNARSQSISTALMARNPEEQLQHFVTELSRRLYWIEEAFHNYQPNLPPPPSLRKSPVPASPTPLGLHPWILVGTSFILCSLGCLLWQYYSNRRTIIFPRRKIHPRLGAPLGGGNKIQIPFNKDLQREKDPLTGEYLVVSAPRKEADLLNQR